jgi:hypothetical protein
MALMQERSPHRDLLIAISDGPPADRKSRSGDRSYNPIGVAESRIHDVLPQINASSPVRL